jgi:hypothetical protein
MPSREQLMSDLIYYQKRREALMRSYLSSGEGEPRPLQTGGVDHLALICSDLERTNDRLLCRSARDALDADRPKSRRANFHSYLLRYGRRQPTSIFRLSGKRGGAYRAWGWQHASRRAQDAAGPDARHHWPARQTSPFILSARNIGRRLNPRPRSR